MTHHITVTPEDISAGCRLSIGNCPVARAISRAMGEPWIVNGSHCHSGNCLTSYKLPFSATHWIHRFDGEAPVQPLTFEIEIP